MPTKSFFPISIKFGVWVELDRICPSMWPRPDPRSKSSLQGFWSSENCTFLRVSPPPFWHWAQNWWLVVILLDLVYFGISFQESYHGSSNFAECRYFTKFKWPYFGTAWGYSHMVGQAGSPTGIAHADMTLTQSNVKVKVTGHLNFQNIVWRSYNGYYCIFLWKITRLIQSL